MLQRRFLLLLLQGNNNPPNQTTYYSCLSTTNKLFCCFASIASSFHSLRFHGDREGSFGLDSIRDYCCKVFRCWPDSLTLWTFCRHYSTAGTMSAALAFCRIRVNLKVFPNCHRMELILWQNNLNLNCVNLNYWQVLFNKTEYYMGFKIVLNLILILNLNFFYLNIEHLKFNTIVFFQGRIL